MKTSRGLRRSQRDYSIENACTSKRPYASWREAEDEVLRIIALNIEQGHKSRSSGLSTYGCPH